MIGGNLAFRMGLCGNNQTDSIMEFSIQARVVLGFGLTFELGLGYESD